MPYTWVSSKTFNIVSCGRLVREVKAQWIQQHAETKKMAQCQEAKDEYSFDWKSFPVKFCRARHQVPCMYVVFIINIGSMIKLLANDTKPGHVEREVKSCRWQEHNSALVSWPQKWNSIQRIGLNYEAEPWCRLYSCCFTPSMDRVQP